MTPDIKALDLEATTRDKILFAAVAIPVSGVLGATLRMFGGISEAVTLMIVLPLLCAAFVAWHVGIAIRRAHRAAADHAHEVWRRDDRDTTPHLERRMHARPR